MIPADFLAILRCPMAPARDVALTQPDDLHLLCPRCNLRFPIKDGFPVLVAEEAELPPGCASLDRLPCQQPPT
ncbi:MAG: hypothetical protein U0746_05735 [Gemmataceae bacterium]